jgi:hypothetical protein
MNSSIPFDVAHRLVLGCVLAPFGYDLADRVGEDASAWTRLLCLATAHGVRPVVARASAATSTEMFAPRQVKGNLTAAARANEGRAKLLTGELLQILDALTAAHIAAVPFKGPAFEHALDCPPGLREMTDLDLFVRAEHLAAATRALEPLGYAPAQPPHALQYRHFDQVTPEWLLLRQADGLLIELHCRVTPSWFPAPCGLDDIEARQQTLTFAGHRIAWPAPEELLLIHIADGMKSCGRGMKWIGDVARILRRHPPQAEALAGDARRTPRLAAALAKIRAGIQNDAPLPGATAHFRWSISLSDHPLRTTAAVVRYLAGPAIADLAQAPAAGSVLPLRARAILRRLRAVVGLRH